jgi:hypothetical protein
MSATSASRTYWREIAALLGAKVAALVLLYVLFFAERPVLPPLADHVFSAETRR